MQNFSKLPFCELRGKTYFYLQPSFSQRREDAFTQLLQKKRESPQHAISLPIMNSTLSHSTHFRATCNSNTDGLVTTDYLRAKTTDRDILQLNSATCVKMEYINIGRYDCCNCMAKMSQTSHWHLHTISHNVRRCQFTSPRSGPLASSGDDGNFGFYKAINPLHKNLVSSNELLKVWVDKGFSPTTTDQNLIFTSATSMTASAPLRPAEKNLTYLLAHSILFTRR